MRLFLGMALGCVRFSVRYRFNEFGVKSWGRQLSAPWSAGITSAAFPVVVAVVMLAEWRWKL